MSSSDGNHERSDATADAHAGHGAPPGPPEPKTPLWLSAVGAVLFLSVGLWWALTAPPNDSSEIMGSPAGAAAPADPPPQRTPTPPPTAAPRRPDAPPGH